MLRTFINGLLAAIIGTVGLYIGDALGISLQNTLLGVGGGLIIAMVRVAPPLARLAGFLIGSLLGIGFVAMRLGLLPGGYSVAGVAIAALIILLVVTIVAGLTKGYVGAWSQLLGALVLVSGFTYTTATTPWSVGYDLPQYYLSLLVMTSIGFLMVIPEQLIPDLRRRKTPEPEEPSEATPVEATS